MNLSFSTLIKISNLICVVRKYNNFVIFRKIFIQYVREYCFNFIAFTNVFNCFIIVFKFYFDEMSKTKRSIFKKFQIYFISRNDINQNRFVLNIFDRICDFVFLNIQ